MARFVLLGALVLLSVFAAPARGAVLDPERNATTPVSWSWFHGHSQKQIDAVRATGMRLIDVEVQDTSPYRFAGVFVTDAGVHARPGADWEFGASRKRLKQLDDSRRFIDLETFTKGGKRRFAVVTVPNTGAWAKGWRWNYDVSAKQVLAAIDKHGIRLADLNAYRVGGKRRYSYVGIKNEGVDARRWWVYFNLSAARMLELARVNGARIVDVERPRKKRYTVVMVESADEFSLVTGDASTRSIGETSASQGSRITELERVGKRWVAVLLDNSDAETARIRSYLHASPYAAGYFGAFAKAVGGRTYVGLGHQSPYQPLSVMKLVPHLYAVDRVDRGAIGLEDQIVWQRPPGMPDDGCPSPGAEQTYSDTLRNVLTRAMRESLNRAHETLLDTWTPEAITEFVRGDVIGMKSTRMYYGCSGKSEKVWTDSRTTLEDMGRLFESVDERRAFTSNWSSSAPLFYDILSGWGDDPAAADNWYRAIVADEAAKLGKSSIVEEFLTKVSVKGKGGGQDYYDADGVAQVPRALSFRASLPFPGWPAGRPFVGGFFASPLPGVCTEGGDLPATGAAECQAFRASMVRTFAGLTAELLRVPIREALEVYPLPPPPGPPDLVLSHSTFQAGSLTVRNQGESAAGPFRVLVDGSTVLSFPDGMPAGGAEARFVGCTGTREAVADDLDAVPEVDETNNRLEWTCHE